MAIAAQIMRRIPLQYVRLGVIALDDTAELAASSHFQLSQLYRRQHKTAEADRHLKRFQGLQQRAR